MRKDLEEIHNALTAFMEREKTIQLVRIDEERKGAIGAYEAYCHGVRDALEQAETALTKEAAHD